ncbi:glyoxalase [Arthrobacter sp. UCD-GKA]|uniref:VOC family protein n=1 Tax=Arthrobacter sp. UCD-GKA TaxID=1913576 RepID=UPI0008DE4C6E|nr:VOC family protein [Arthrobacter sp. UCD-GKA]OIH85074.1 glyoxalase [Arthrobacter sp. UCD-GKA]
MPKPALPVGSPCWIDLLTSNPEKSKEFYNALFGWTYETGDQEKYGGYVTASKDEAMVAGIMKNDGTSGSPDTWTTYLRVDDIDAAAKSAAEHGGQVYLPPMEVPDQGKMAMFGDASGAAVGIWEFGGHTGYQLAAENGAPAWHELFTRDFAPAVKFYQDVFGWKTAVVGDTDEFRYTTLGEGDNAKAGIMDASSFLPEGAPPSWHVYFAVDNADDVVAKTVALGGAVIQPAEDTPFGRNAALTDPTGAEFWITQDIGQGR